MSMAFSIHDGAKSKNLISGFMMHTGQITTVSNQRPNQACNTLCGDDRVPVSGGKQFFSQFLAYRSHTGQVENDIHSISLGNQFINADNLDPVSLSGSPARGTAIFHDSGDCYAFAGRTKQYF